MIVELQAGRAKLAAKRKADAANAERQKEEKQAAREAAWKQVIDCVHNDVGWLAEYASTMPEEFTVDTDRVTITFTIPNIGTIHGCWGRHLRGPWHTVQNNAGGFGDTGRWRINRYQCWGSGECDYLVGTTTHYTDDLDIALAMAEEEELRRPAVEAEVFKRNADREVANQRREQRRIERENAKTTGEKLLDLLTDLIDERIPQTEDA